MHQIKIFHILIEHKVFGESIRIKLKNATIKWLNCSILKSVTVNIVMNSIFEEDKICMN